MKKIAIMGAGALGTILGAYITLSGKDVLLIDNYKEHVDALNKYGAKVVGEDNLVVPVKACTPDEMEGFFDIVFYITKAPANSVALPQLLPHLNENSVVCVLQNGLPEGPVAEYVGIDRVVGCTVNWGGGLQGLGTSHSTVSAKARADNAFEIGELDGKKTDRIKEISDILSVMGKVHVLENFSGARWAKLFVNATYSGLSAALGCSYGDIMDDEFAFKVSTYVANEVVKAARLNGIKIIDEYNGQDIKKAEFNTEEERLEAAKVVLGVFDRFRLVNASMLNDMRRGIWNVEIDQINGSVVSEGEKVGLDTPFNRKIVELVKRACSTQTLPSWENLMEFEELVRQAKEIFV